VGGKSKSVTVGYKHFVGMHWVFAHGPLDSIGAIKVDNRVAWSGIATGGTINVSAEELFGGESREGGVSGAVDIEMGALTQTKNAYLLSKIGLNIPAYRGVAALVFKDFYWGNNPYIKAISVRGTRIMKAQDGATQWYSGKAQITSGGGGLFSLSTAFPTIGGIAPGAFHPNTLILGPFSQDTAILAGQANGSGFAEADNVFVFDGVDQPNDPVYPHLTVYPGGTLVKNLAAGQTFTIRIKNLDGGSPCGASGHLYAGGPTIDMNPAHMIRECLTNEDWGMGYADEDVDDASFEAAADTLFDERMGMSLLWDKQTKIEDFISEVVRHIDAALYVSRSTGRFVLKLIRADYDIGDLIVLDETNIEKVDNPSRTAFGELINSVTVAFWNAVTGKDDGVTLNDPAGVQMQGGVINTTVQYPGFTSFNIATRICARDLRTLSSPFFSCTILTGEVARNLEIGDVFVLNWGKWKIVNTPMRVTGLAISDGKSTQVRITCVEDVFSTPLNAVIAPPGDGWVDPSQPPDPVAEQIAIEAPYYELVQINGQTTTDTDLTTNPELGYVLAAAGRPGSAINAKLWTDPGDGYEEADVMDFAPTAQLTAPVGKKDTVFAVENMIDLDLVPMGSHCQIGEELARVDDIDTDAGLITLGRGVLDTVPHVHLTGDTIYFWDLFAGGDPTEYASGESVDVRITPVSGAGQVALGDAIESTVTLAQRAVRPYPPGDLTINGDSYVDQTYSGELTVAWKHRDRLQQTSGELADHFDGDIGPEPGTLYRVRTYIDDVLDDEQDDLAVATASVTPAFEGIARVEVSSKRDDIYSMQAATHEFPYTASGEPRAIEDGDDYRYAEDDGIRITED
jgi:hypothetical protein